MAVENGLPFGARYLDDDTASVLIHGTSMMLIGYTAGVVLHDISLML